MGSCFSPNKNKNKLGKGPESQVSSNLQNVSSINSYEEISNNKDYIYSILCCLSYTKVLTKFFLSKYNYYNNYNNQTSNEYYNLLINLWKEKNISYPYSPHDLKSFINSGKFSLSNNNQINDGKSFLNYLLDNIHDELNITNNNNGNIIQNKHTFMQLNKQLTLQNFFNNFKNNYNSIISNLFYGTYEIIFDCAECEKTNYKYEIFKVLEFSLNEIDSFFGIKPTPIIVRGLRFPTNVKKIDLNKCFEYRDKDKAVTTKALKCIYCHNEQYFHFSSKIFSMPNYLILILTNEKQDLYNVNYPEILDLSNYTAHKEIASKFNLYAVIGKNVNNGKSCNEEEFTFCRNLTNDYKWHKYGNNGVEQCKNKEYLEVMPSFLFYEVVKSK